MNGIVSHARCDARNRLIAEADSRSHFLLCFPLWLIAGMFDDAHDSAAGFLGVGPAILNAAMPRARSAMAWWSLSPHIKWCGHDVARKAS